MTEREALKLALEALEEAWYHVGTFQPTEKAIDLYDEARTAIKEALAQPEQKPVSIPDCGEAGHADGACGNRQCLPSFRRNTTPPPVAEPHKRKPLTDEEIQYAFRTNSIMIDDGNAYMVAGKRAINIARAIEAAHGIKENI